MMKKFIAIVLFSFMPLLPSPGQVGMPVTDPAHTASTVLGHLRSFEEAVRNGAKLVEQATGIDSVYANIKKVRETYDKVNKYIYEMQDIIQAAEGLVYIIQESANIYRQAARSNLYSPGELNHILSSLTNAIEQGTYHMNAIKDVLLPDKLRLTDKERLDMFKEHSEKMQKIIDDDINAAREELTKVTKRRAKIAYMNQNDMFTPMELYITNVTGRMTLGEELKFALSNAMKRKADEKVTARTAAKQTTDLYNDLKKIFFALSALVAFIGAFRVYQKFNLEEDGLGKTAAIWFTSALMIFILGSIVELFLF